MGKEDKQMDTNFKLTCLEKLYADEVKRIERAYANKTYTPIGLTRDEWFCFLRGQLLGYKLAFQVVTRLRRTCEISTIAYRTTYNTQLEIQNKRRGELIQTQDELEKKKRKEGLSEDENGTLWRTLGKLQACEKLIAELEGVSDGN
jgi:hypothetical protein